MFRILRSAAFPLAASPHWRRQAVAASRFRAQFAVRTRRATLRVRCVSNSARVRHRPIVRGRTSQRTLEQHQVVAAAHADLVVGVQIAQARVKARVRA